MAFCLLGAAISLIPWRWRSGPIDAPRPNRPAAYSHHRRGADRRPGADGTCLQRFSETRLGQPVFLPGAARWFFRWCPVCWLRAAPSRDPWSLPRFFVVAMLLGSPVYSWVRYQREPDDGPYRPLPEAALEITPALARALSFAAADRRLGLRDRGADRVLQSRSSENVFEFRPGLRALDRLSG